MGETLIVTTEPSRYFAEMISARTGMQILGVERKTFGDPVHGEHYLRLNIDREKKLYGKNVIVVGGTYDDLTFNEVTRLGTAIAKYGACRVAYANPFSEFTTMERAKLAGEVVTAKVIARQFSQLPQGDLRNAFLFMDLHVSGFVHYFEGECLRDELYAEDVLVEGIDELGLENFMFASADLGRPLWVQSFARRYKTPLALVIKEREFEKTKVVGLIGDVKGRKVIIYDDMTRSVGSLVESAEAYLDRGATDVYAVLSHLAFNDEPAIDRLLASPIKRMVGTNSHPMSQHPKVKNSDRFIVKDVSEIYTEAIVQLI